MSSDVQKRFISHREIFSMSTELGLSVAESRFNPELLIAVWRGGALPCTVVHEVLLRTGQACRTAILTAKSYEGIAKRGNEVRTEGLEAVVAQCQSLKRVLIVDDIVDTGHTLRHLKQALQSRCPQLEVRFAALYQRSRCDVEVDYVNATDDHWLVFPHEMEGLTDVELLDHDHLDAGQHARLLAMIVR
ncbi:MAG TPA: phosphoribosyltransferase family protein [Pseudomonadales bacterium]|nr:phosphoribosyltransferase family protein [Pseudomonadales bacterium]